MAHFVGPRMYYSIFGVRGLLLGAEARILRKRISVSVAHPKFPHPVHLRLRTTDVALCREILVRGQYECDLARPPRTIVDAGANIGLASVFFANKYPQARIIAIEPELSNYTMLVKNTACYPNVTTVQAALWNRNTEIHLADLGSGHTAFQTREDAGSKPDAISKVRAMTVDRLMDECQIDAIDLLKIDIEGAEKELFDSPELWIRRVGMIAIEIHEHLRPGSSASIQAAAVDFESVWTEGEITYFARSALVTARMPRRSSDSVLPLRILETR